MSSRSGELVSYEMSSSRTEEERRLIAQSRLFNPMTESVLREAGIGPGMHVVDLGAGAGDVCLLLAELVGPSGSVLGVEQSADAIALASRRVAEAGVGNVDFVHGDIAALSDVLAGRAAPDAITGRCILIWVPQRIEVLRACARLVRPGGLVVFDEPDLAGEPAMPCPPLWGQAMDWLTDVTARIGVEQRMGPMLYATFRAAGLAAPQLRGRTLMWRPEEAPVWWWANTLRALLPAMEAHGFATAMDVDPDTLEKRMTEELIDADAVMMMVPFVGAWARTPG